MKRSASVLRVAVTVLVLGAASRAQSIPGNENDLQLENGIDIIYLYSDPSLGPGVGTSGHADFATNDIFWKVYSRDVLRSCSGTLEVTGIDVLDFDTAYGIYDAGGHNTALPDFFLGPSDSVHPPVNPGQIEPDQTSGTLISFGPGTPKNNLFITDPGCPMRYLNGYEFDVDLTGGAGVGSGIAVTADGATDLVLTTFLPGLQTDTGSIAGGCGMGDGAEPGAYSSSISAPYGETQFDLIGGGLYSKFGGYGSAGVLGGTDGVSEAACNFLEFAEPMLAMHVDSGPDLTGHDHGLEEGLAGVHYDCPSGLGGKIGARLYAWQGIGHPAAVLGTISPPQSSCVNFKGGQLGLNPVDPMFSTFLNLWQGAVIQTDNGWPPTGTPYDDGTFTTPMVPLPAQAVPVGNTVVLSFQGFFKGSSGNAVGSQVTRFFLHG